MNNATSVSKNEWEALWEKLGTIPVNENDEIEEPFESFPAGTDKIEIWDWFEETYNISIAKDCFKFN